MGLWSRALRQKNGAKSVSAKSSAKGFLAKANALRSGIVLMPVKKGLLSRASLQWSSKASQEVGADVIVDSTKGLNEEGVDNMKAGETSSVDEIRSELDKKLLDFTNIFEISKEVNSTLNIEELLSILIFAIMGQFGVKQVSIFALDGNSYLMKAQRGLDAVEGLSFSKDSDFISRLLEQDKPCDFDFFGDFAGSESLAGMKIIVPLQNSGALSGFIVLGERFSGDDYSSEELDFLSTMASMAAIAIDNARLYTNLENKLNEFSALYDISRVINSTGTLEEVVNLAVETLTTGFGLEQAAFLCRKDGDYKILSSIGLDSQTIEQLYFSTDNQIVNTIFEVGEAIDFPDFRDKPELVSLISASDVDKFQSFLVVPLLAAGEKVGVLLIFSVQEKEESFFMAEEIQLFSIIASQLAPPILMAEMFKKEQDEAVDPYSPYVAILQNELDNAASFSLSLGVGEIKINGFADDNNSELITTFLGKLGSVIKSAVGTERKVVRTAVNKYSILFPGVSIVDQEDALIKVKIKIVAFLKEQLKIDSFEVSTLTVQLPEDYASPEVYLLHNSISNES